MRQIALDTETTGLDHRSDRLLELGCVNLETGEVYHQYINPVQPISKQAQSVHGLSDEFLSDKPLFNQIAQEFLEFIKGAELIIHNRKFDMRFINAELYRAKLPFLDNPVICTLEMAKKILPGKKHNLDNLCRIYKIDNSNRELHGALLDAELLAKVYHAMTYREASLFDAIGGDSTAIREAEKPCYHGRKPNYVKPLPQELQLHDDFRSFHRLTMW